MGIEYLMKTRGYGYFTGHMEGNDRVWKVAKMYGGESLTSELSKFRRHKPSLDLMREDLWKFDRQAPRRPSDALYSLVRDITKRRFQPAQKFRVMPAKDVDPFTFPQGTSAGYPYAMQGIGKKGIAFPYAMQKATAIERRLLDGQEVTFGPCLVYPRAVVSPVEKPKCRTIFCAPLDLCILQASYAKNEWRHQKEGVTPAAYDYTPFSQGYHRLRVDMVKPGNQYLNTDFSKYDGSIPSWLVSDVCEDWLDSFELDSYSNGDPIVGDLKRLIRRCNKTVVFTKILMPDGSLYEKNIGTASGDYIFQLIQNRVSYLITLYCLLSQGVPFYQIRKIKALGDDVLASFLYPNFSFDVYSQTMLRVFGVIINVEKSNLTDDPDKITFLGRKLKGSQSARETADILLALLYPEENAQDDVLLAMRCVSLMYENSGSNSVAEWCIRAVWHDIPLVLRQYLEKRDDLEWPKRWTYLFRNLGFDSPPKCILPTMLDLIPLIYNAKHSRIPKYDDLSLFIH